jgi:DnaK suppressor protein
MQKYPKKVLEDLENYYKQEKEHLLKRMKQLTETDPFLDPDHVNDNADVTTDVREEITHEQTVAMQESLQKKLSEIEEVLRRIQSGSYGFCKQCGQMIDTDRLSSNPLATLCISCAKK